MNQIVVIRSAMLFAAASMIFTGCAVPQMSQEDVRREVRGLTPTVFPQPLARVQDAAGRALTTVGCEIREKQDYYVSGSRPRHMGLIVGSGGEVVDVYMLPENDKSTDVWVNTDKSFVGIVGQRNWDAKTMDALKECLK